MKLLNTLVENIASNKKSHFWIFFIVLCLLSVYTTISYYNIQHGDDFYFHLRRFNALTDAFRDGTFPSYIDYKAIQGYGYLSNTFYSDIILLPFALINMFTGSEFAYRFMIFFMTAFCGISMYWSMKIIYKNTFAAFLSAILFCFCNYRLFALYNRGALGETLAFSFFPLIMLGLYYIIFGNYKRNWYVIAIGFTLIIYTHVLSSIIAFITTIIFIAIYNKPLRQEPRRLLYLLLAGGVTLLSTSYFVFSLLEQMLSNSFYYQSQAWADPSLYSTSIYWLLLGMTEGLTQPEQFFFPKIGLLLCIGLFVRLFIYEKSVKLKSIDIFVIVGLAYLACASNLVPWKYLPSTIQFPWRLFAFVSFFFAIAGGYYISRLMHTKIRSLIALVLFIFFISVIVAGGSVNYNRTINPERLAWNAPPEILYHNIGGGMEYLPSRIHSKDFFDERDNTTLPTRNDTHINNFVRDGKFTRFDVTLVNKDNLELPLIYYKGYSVKLDGKEIPIKQSDNGLIQIIANQSGRVEAYYKGTTTQYASFAITIASILALCAYLYTDKKRRIKTVV